MAKTSAEIRDLAEEIVTDVLNSLETVEEKNNSFFRVVPKPTISYLITQIRLLSSTVLNLSQTAATAERLIALKDTEIADLNRDVLDLKLKLAQNTEPTVKNNEKDSND